MAGKFDGLDSESINYHLHWRYFYDPPEFLTVLSGEEKSGLHVGYFRYRWSVCIVEVSLNKSIVK